MRAAWKESLWRQSNMDDLDYTPELYTLCDEDGVEQTFEMVDYYEEGDNRYYAMIPYYEDPNDLIANNGELVILKADDTSGEEMLVTIDDDNEYDRIGAIFLERLENFYDGDEADPTEDDGISS